MTRGALDVGDGAAGGHPADISGVHHLVGTQAVLVLEFSFEQVGEGGQADMRMLADIHASPGRVGGLQHVIEEHERPDAAAFGGRQWAKNRLAFDIFGAGANGQGVVMLSSRLNNGCTKHNPSPADAADTP